MKHLKSEFDKLTIREFLAYTMAMILTVTSIIAIFLSLYIHPEGEIHHSVLVYYSISSATAASLLGVAMYVNSKFQTITASITDRLSNLEPRAMNLEPKVGDSALRHEGPLPHMPTA